MRSQRKETFAPFHRCNDGHIQKVTSQWSKAIIYKTSVMQMRIMFKYKHSVARQVFVLTSTRIKCTHGLNSSYQKCISRTWGVTVTTTYTRIEKSDS